MILRAETLARHVSKHNPSELHCKPLRLSFSSGCRRVCELKTTPAASISASLRALQISNRTYERFHSQMPKWRRWFLQQIEFQGEAASLFLTLFDRNHVLLLQQSSAFSANWSVQSEVLARISICCKSSTMLLRSKLFVYLIFDVDIKLIILNIHVIYLYLVDNRELKILKTHHEECSFNFESIQVKIRLD